MKKCAFRPAQPSHGEASGSGIVPEPSSQVQSHAQANGDTILDVKTFTASAFGGVDIPAEFVDQNCAYLLDMGNDANGRSILSPGKSEHIVDRDKTHKANIPTGKMIMIAAVGNNSPAGLETWLMQHAEAIVRKVTVHVDHVRRLGTFACNHVEREHVLTTIFEDMPKCRPEVVACTYTDCNGIRHFFRYAPVVAMPNDEDLRTKLALEQAQTKRMETNIKLVNAQAKLAKIEWGPTNTKLVNAKAKLAKIELDKIRLQLTLAKIEYDP